MVAGSLETCILSSGILTLGGGKRRHHESASALEFSCPGWYTIFTSYVLSWVIHNLHVFYTSAVHSCPPFCVLRCWIHSLKYCSHRCLVCIHYHRIPIQVVMKMRYRPDYCQSLKFCDCISLLCYAQGSAYISGWVQPLVSSHRDPNSFVCLNQLNTDVPWFVPHLLELAPPQPVAYPPATLR